MNVDPKKLAARLQIGDAAIAALRALMSNEHVRLGDLCYYVRDRELQGWEGPGVVAWGKAVMEAEALLKRADEHGL